MLRTSQAFRHRTLTAAPWLISLALGVRLAWAGIGFDGLYGQDSYEFARFAANLSSYLAGSAELSHFFWPIGYPLAVVIGSWLPFVGNLVLGGQLVSLLAGSSIPAAVGLAARRLGGSRWSGATSASIAAASGLLWVSSSVVMSDALAVAMIAWSVAVLAPVMQAPTDLPRRQLCLALALAGGAVVVRWPLLPPALVLAIWSMVRHRQVQRSSNVRASAGPVVPIISFVTPIALSAALLTRNIGVGVLDNSAKWRLSNFLDSSFPGALENLPLPNFALYLFGPLHPSLLGLFGFLALLSLASWMRHRDQPTPPAIWLLLASLSVTFVASGYPLRNPRFLLPTLPLLSVLAGLVLDPFLATVGSHRLRLVPQKVLLSLVLAALLINLSFAELRLRETVARKQSIRTTIDEVVHHFEQASLDFEQIGATTPLLWTFEIAGPLTYYTNLEVHDLYLESASHGSARRDSATQNPARQLATGQDPTGQHATGKYSTGQYVLMRPEVMAQSTLRWRTTKLHENLDYFRKTSTLQEIPLRTAQASGYHLYRLLELDPAVPDPEAPASSSGPHRSNSTQ